MSSKPSYKRDAFIGDLLVERAEIYEHADEEDGGISANLRLRNGYDGIDIDVYGSDSLDALDALIDELVDYSVAIKSLLVKAAAVAE